MNILNALIAASVAASCPLSARAQSPSGIQSGQDAECESLREELIQEAQRGGGRGLEQYCDDCARGGGPGYRVVQLPGRGVAGKAADEIATMTCDELRSLAARAAIIRRDPDQSFAGGDGLFISGIQTNAEASAAAALALAESLGLDFQAIDNPAQEGFWADLMQAANEKLHEFDERMMRGGLVDSLAGSEASYFGGLLGVILDGLLGLDTGGLPYVNPHKDTMIDVMSAVYDSVTNGSGKISIVAHSEGALLIKHSLELLNTYFPELNVSDNVRVMTLGGAASSLDWPVQRVHHVYDPNDAVAAVVGPSSSTPSRTPGIEVEHSLEGYIDHLQPEFWAAPRTEVVQQHSGSQQ